jgi:hypothetical protein
MEFQIWLAGESPAQTEVLLSVLVNVGVSADSLPPASLC